MKIQQKSIVIYDSNCRFCIVVTDQLKKKDRNDKLNFLSVQSRETRTLLQEKGIHFIDLQTIYFIHEEKVFVRSAAVFKIFSLLPFPYKLLSGLSILPLLLTDFIYDRVAKNRHKIIK